MLCSLIMQSHDVKPDAPLTSSELAKTETLRPEDIALIDQTLLSCVNDKWRKVARVVATALSELNESLPGIPDKFYAFRVRELARSGMLESQGDLSYMRYSEVRLAKVQS